MGGLLPMRNVETELVLPSGDRTLRILSDPEAAFEGGRAKSSPEQLVAFERELAR